MDGALCCAGSRDEFVPSRGVPVAAGRFVEDTSRDPCSVVAAVRTGVRSRRPCLGPMTRSSCETKECQAWLFQRSCTSTIQWESWGTLQIKRWVQEISIYF